MRPTLSRLHAQVRAVLPAVKATNPGKELPNQRVLTLQRLLARRGHHVTAAQAVKLLQMHKAMAGANCLTYDPGKAGLPEEGKDE